MNQNPSAADFFEFINTNLNCCDGFTSFTSGFLSPSIFFKKSFCSIILILYNTTMQRGRFGCSYFFISVLSFSNPLDNSDLQFLHSCSISRQSPSCFSPRRNAAKSLPDILRKEELAFSEREESPRYLSSFFQ